MRIGMPACLVFFPVSALHLTQAVSRSQVLASIAGLVRKGETELLGNMDVPNIPSNQVSV